MHENEIWLVQEGQILKEDKPIFGLEYDSER